MHATASASAKELLWDKCIDTWGEKRRQLHAESFIFVIYFTITFGPSINSTLLSECSPKCVLHKFFLLRFLFLKSQEQTPKCSSDTLKTTSVLQINSSDKDILGSLKLPVTLLFSEGPAEKSAGLCTNQLHSLSNHRLACLGLLSGVIPFAFVSSHYLFTRDRVARAMECTGIEVRG